MLLEDSVLETEKPKRTTATFFVVVCFLVFFSYYYSFEKTANHAHAQGLPQPFPTLDKDVWLFFF